MCAKLHTVAASNNRDHPTRSLPSSRLASTINCLPGSCSRHAYIFLFFTHIPFVVNHTINATPPEGLQHLNASAGHWNCYGGPHVARGPLIAHPWPKLWPGAYQPRTTTSSFAWFTRNSRYDSVNCQQMLSCGFTNWSSWHSWKPVRRPSGYQHKIWTTWTLDKYLSNWSCIGNCLHAYHSLLEAPLALEGQE